MRSFYIISITSIGAPLNRLPAAGVGATMMATIYSQAGKVKGAKKGYVSCGYQIKPNRGKISDRVYLRFPGKAAVIVDLEKKTKGSATTPSVSKKAAEPWFRIASNTV